MNALKCRILIATCPCAPLLCVYSIAHCTCVCLFNIDIRSIELHTLAAAAQSSGTVLFRVSAWSRSWGKAPGYITIILYKLKPLWHTCTWEPLPIYTISALSAAADQQQSGGQPLHRLATLLGRTNMPSIYTFSLTTLTIQHMRLATTTTIIHGCALCVCMYDIILYVYECMLSCFRNVIMIPYLIVWKMRSFLVKIVNRIIKCSLNWIIRRIHLTTVILSQ